MMLQKPLTRSWLPEEEEEEEEDVLLRTRNLIIYPLGIGKS
jgi:hypothetical protein